MDEFRGKDLYTSNNTMKMLAYLVVKQWCEDGHPNPVPYEFIDMLVSVSNYPVDIYERWKNEITV